MSAYQSRNHQSIEEIQDRRRRELRDGKPLTSEEDGVLRRMLESYDDTYYNDLVRFVIEYMDSESTYEREGETGPGILKVFDITFSVFEGRVRATTPRKGKDFVLNDFPVHGPWNDVARDIMNHFVGNMHGQFYEIRRNMADRVLQTKAAMDVKRNERSKETLPKQEETNNADHQTG